MLSKVESGKSTVGESSSGRLLHDIEEISKALYLHKAPQKALVPPSRQRSKSAGRTRVSESKSDLVSEDAFHKDKKSSIWNWKPLKAFAHIRNRRYSCCFLLHVHAIEGLPSNFNALRLCVLWKRKDDVVQTCPARVYQGVAEFEETLMHPCSVYGSRNGPQSAKYEPKLFLLYASVVGAPGLDIGKHWIDLTKLLPLTLEELEGEKSSGKWTTCFKLTGKAKGAIMNVSFGFSVMGDNSFQSSNNMHFPKPLKEHKRGTVSQIADLGQGVSNCMPRMVVSIPNNSNIRSPPLTISSDTKILNEVFPNQGSELARSVTYLYQKLEEVKLGSSRDFDFFYEHVEPIKGKPVYFSEFLYDDIGNGCDNTEFTIIERGIEFPVKEELQLEGDAQNSDSCAVETIDVAEIFKDDGVTLDEEAECNSKEELCINSKDEVVVNDSRFKENDLCSDESTAGELESVLHNLLASGSAEFDSSLVFNELTEQENYRRTKSSYRSSKVVKSLSLDDVAESVANDFLNILGIEQSPLGVSEIEPESPRERLLRQFEEEALASGNFSFDSSLKEEQLECGGAALTAELGEHVCNFDLQCLIQTAEEDHQRVTQLLKSNRNAKILENLETEALMQEWGLNERAFQNSPRCSSGGFGSPVYLPHEQPLEFPPLGEGLGPIVRTKAGGFLRSMNPLLFKNAKNGLSLIMQVSSPIVLPAAMGSDILEILQHWTSVGSEKMFMQANKLMPLEDISGKTIQGVVQEANSTMKVPERLPFLQQESVGQDSFSYWGFDNLSSNSVYAEVDSDYVSPEDLTPLAMDKIETLSVDGLKIQSGMLDEEAPSSLRPQSLGKTSFFLGKREVGGCFSLQGAVGSQLSDVKDENDVVDELISLSITLDEWMRLDSTVTVDEDEISERTTKILAAHHANYMDLANGQLASSKKWGTPLGRRGGFLGNNLTVALLVQLRDPLRDYEMVGTPMLALIQADRVFVPWKPKVHFAASARSSHREGVAMYGEMAGGVTNVEEDTKIEEKYIPMFKISEVHVAGVNTDPGKKQVWGTRAQQQSGARWLLASCMGRTKHAYLKSNVLVKPSSQAKRKKQPEETLWSISSPVPGKRAKWKELAVLNLHVRNPDISF